MAYQVLITGANRGIGFEFTKQYAQDGWNVLACCRDTRHAIALQALANAHTNIRILSLDVGDFAQIDALALQLKNEKIDVLINNAGIYPESSLCDANTENWLEAFKINSIAPFKMATAFTAHVANSGLKKITTLSSKMGSISDNTSGGSYIYRSTNPQ
jgi:NAD(P)-dependent dehydrogenase (short-subunit alcohol dehydrogenase family)